MFSGNCVNSHLDKNAEAVNVEDSSYYDCIKP